jgi:hypothetical protein
MRRLFTPATAVLTVFTLGLLAFMPPVKASPSATPAVR